jgi:hypothetical protein
MLSIYSLPISSALLLSINVAVIVVVVNFVVNNNYQSIIENMETVFM